MNTQSKFQSNEYEEIFENLFTEEETVQQLERKPSKKILIKRGIDLTITDLVFLPLMVAALIVGVDQVATYIMDEKLIGHDPVVILTTLSFIQLVYRMLIGGIQYNRVSYELGVNDIDTQRKYLRWKAMFGGIAQIIQSLLFILLGYCIIFPSEFLLVYFILIAFNSIWLGFENRCLIQTKVCVSRKQSCPTLRIDPELFEAKIGMRSKLQEVIGIWTENNWLFAVITVMCIMLHDKGVDGCILVGIIATLINSMVDFWLTFPFYKNPFDFVQRYRN